MTKHMEKKILLIYLLRYRIQIGHLAHNSLHTYPFDLDCVHSHVEGVKSDNSGFVAQVFLNE